MPYRESLFSIIGIHMAAILPVEEHLELQIILLHRAPLLDPIHIADVDQKCYRGPLPTAPDYRTPVRILG